MVFTALEVKTTLELNPKMFPESNATNANFTRANDTQLLSSGCNLVATETTAFLTAVLFVWEKSLTDMYCAKEQSVFGRLLTMDCQKHALEHCVIGLFGWMNQSFRSQCVSADKLITRTQF